jgi:parallel beta-helix repeat protein
MRAGIAAFVLAGVLPVLATAHAAEGLSERQQRIREALRTDVGGPAPLPPLKCGRTNYTANESGKRTVVTDAEGLKSALQRANAGDVIELGAGDYGWVELKDLHFSDYVRVEGTDQARIKHLGLTDVTYLQIEGVNFEYGLAEGENWKPKLLEMKNARHIRIINSAFVGNKNTKTWHGDIPDTAVRAYGGSRDIVIAGTRFSHVARGVIFQQVDGYTIENNSLTDMGCDGLFFQNSSNGLIESNYFSNFRPFIYAEQGKTCHADFIQFDAGKGRNTLTPSSDVTIRGNVMLQGQSGSLCSGVGSVCGAVQGVFLEGAMGIHPETGKEHKFTNITIADNVYCASGINGLYVHNGKNVSIVNNAHYTCLPPFGAGHSSNITLRGSHTGSKVAGNTERRVSDQTQALADAKRMRNLDNCVLKNL